MAEPEEDTNAMEAIVEIGDETQAMIRLAEGQLMDAWWTAKPVDELDFVASRVYLAVIGIHVLASYVILMSLGGILM